MQKVLIALSLLSSAAIAQDTRPFEFEASPGCLSSAGQALCVVSNPYSAAVTCKIKVTMKTERGRLIGNEKTVMIGPQRFETVQVFPAQGDSVKEVSSIATCKAE